MTFPDKPVAHLLGSNGPIHAVTYSAGAGTYILTGSSDRAIRLYNPLPTVGTAGRLPSKSVQGGFIGKDQDVIARAAIPEGRLIQTYAEHGYEVLSLACAADNARFVSAGGDRAVFLWDVSTAQTLRRFSGHTGRVNCVCFAGRSTGGGGNGGDDGGGGGPSDDALVISGGFDTTVRIWDTRSSSTRSIQTLTDARDAITAVVASGPEIVAASVDGRVRSYDVRMGRVTTDVVSGTAPVTSLALSRDGRSLLVTTLDSRLRLLDRANGACLRTYAVSDHWVNEELRVPAIFGARERFVIAGDEVGIPASRPTASATTITTTTSLLPSGRIWAWDLITGSVVATISVPWGPPGSASTSRAIGRDGREKERRNVTSCIAWQDGGWGEQFCVGGTSGVVTVFGPR